MSQQSQNDHYPDLRSLALAYADAVNEELRDLAGRRRRRRPDRRAVPPGAPGRRAGVRARGDHAGASTASGDDRLHTCFGYAAIVHEKPNGYPFLAELDSCPADQISIEAAQPRLDPSLLEELPTKHVILGVLDLGDMSVETPRSWPSASGRHCATSSPTPDGRARLRMKYLPREVARGKLRALVDGAAAVRAEL